MKKRERDFSKIRDHIKRYRRLRAIGRKWDAFCRFVRKWLGWLSAVKFLNPFRYLKRLDRYIISKFIGTYIYSIILIISISIVFDVNENLSKFASFNAPLKAIVFDYTLTSCPISPIFSHRCSSLSR